MEKNFKMRYFRSIYERYHRASKRLKAGILDEFCRVCGYNRKYAIGKLNGPPLEEQRYLKQKARERKQRPTTYTDQTIDTLAKVWEAANYPCATRLKALLPLWLPWIEKHFQLNFGVKEQLLGISPRQIDRRLQKRKLKAKRRIYGGTKPGTLLKHQIPIKTDQWNVKEPGFTEIDTVAHSGNSAAGVFAYSVNQADILTGWVETRAILGKGERDVSRSIEEMEQYFPFRIRGIDADNGGEFINHHLHGICQRKEIQLTRGRPYKKDDNAHIEQKNWTHVRKLFGWSRFDTRAVVEAMNDLYRNELHLFMNLFLPSTKLLKKKRIGSKVRRYYDTPKTPLNRLIESGKGDHAKIGQLNHLQAALDPFQLSKTIEKKIERVIKMANCRQSPKVTRQDKENQATNSTLQQLSCRELQVFKEVSNLFGIGVLAGNSQSQVLR